MKPSRKMKSLEDSLSKFSEDFMEEREPPPSQERSFVGAFDDTPVCKALPEGWEWKTLGEVAEVIRGVSYAKNDASEIKKAGDLPILRATNIQDNGLVLTGC